jgi:class 3 adenylate cyclase
VEALEQIRAEVPDLILSDVMMPRLDGYGLCAAVKGDPATAHVPVILLTAQAALDARVRGLGVQADDYLSKPFHEEELLARVKNLLLLRRQAAELRNHATALQEVNRGLEVRVLEQADVLQRRSRLQRFLAPAVVEELLGQDPAAALERRRRVVAVLSAELCQFDQLAGAMEPEDLTVLFGRFHTVTTEAVWQHGGTLAGLSGGSLLAVFGAPRALSDAEAAEAAVRAARALLARIEALATQWGQLAPGQLLALRGGIDLGHATVGAFGDGEWASFAAVGGPAARAPRLRDAAAHGEVLVSARVAKLVGADEGLAGPRPIRIDQRAHDVWRLGGSPAPGGGLSDTTEPPMTPVDVAADTPDVAARSAEGMTRDETRGRPRVVGRVAPPARTPEAPGSGGYPPQDSPVGKTLGGRYRIERELGQGGMATVYAASDELLGQRIAIKLLHRQRRGGDIERLRREVRLARLVTHPNVCRVFDLQILDGMACVTMELVPGRSLAAILHERSVPVAQAIAWARQICDGLTAAHACGIVHRDLKPDNVLVEDSGRVLIADFGIARPADRHTPDGIAGTLDYLAPEQINGASGPDARSDIYSLGVLLFRLFTGALPFSGEQALSRAMARCTDPPRDPAGVEPSIDPTVRAVILRCLERDVATRFQRVADVSAALAAVSLGEGEATLTGWSSLAPPRLPS